MSATFALLGGWAGPALGEPAMGDFVNQYCVDCHDGAEKKGGLDLEEIMDAGVGGHAEVWEKVVRRMGARQMPPPKKDRPSEEE